MGQSDSDEVSCGAWTNKQSKVVQPDLNFVGEERITYHILKISGLRDSLDSTALRIDS